MYKEILQLRSVTLAFQNAKSNKIDMVFEFAIQLFQLAPNILALFNI